MTGGHPTGRSRWAGFGMAATAAVVAVALASPLPGAGASKGGGKGGGGGSGDTPAVQECDTFGGSYTLAQLRADTGADVARDSYGLTGAGIDVAVIDTGIAPVRGLDAPGHVIDGPDLSFDGENAALRHNDAHGHGTNMAAIIGARGTAYGSGVAPGARIIDVKVGAGDGSVDVSQVIAGIDWAIQNKNARGMNIRVISLAFGTDASASYRTDPLSYAVERAWRAGIVVVAAGGNDGRSIQRLANPAFNPFVIAVGAAEKKQNNWSAPTWSSTGDGVRNPDFIVPGSQVLSLAVPGSHLATIYSAATCTHAGTATHFIRGDGTSQAAAATAGLVALLLEQRPSLTPDQVKAILVGSAVSTNSNNDAQGGAGRATLHNGNNRNPLGALVFPTPSPSAAAQSHAPALGTGTLHAARGAAVVGDGSDLLTGEWTAFGTPFSSQAWRDAATLGATWTNQTWSGATWSGGTWSGATWSGATWSGATWSGATWSGATWSGATWSGATWSGATWSGGRWA